MFLAVFPQYEQLRVIDVGGYPWNWSGRMMPAQLTVVNLDLEPGTWQTSGIRCIRGDATDLPDSLLDEGFDLVYSNSVIEHVGGYEMRRRFANMTNRLAPSHWVQTPNRWFPIEPHVLFPAQQFLPLPARARIARSWPLAHGRGRDAAETIDDVLRTELLTATEMRILFPDGELLRERFGGLTKSLIAVRR